MVFESLFGSSKCRNVVILITVEVYLQNMCVFSAHDFSNQINPMNI